MRSCEIEIWRMRSCEIEPIAHCCVSQHYWMSAHAECQWRSYTGARGGHGPPSFWLGPGHAHLVFLSWHTSMIIEPSCTERLHSVTQHAPTCISQTLNTVSVPILIQPALRHKQRWVHTKVETLSDETKHGELWYTACASHHHLSGEVLI